MLDSRCWHDPLLRALETLWYPQSVLCGLRAHWLSPCLDGDALRAARNSLLLFVLQYVRCRIGDALHSEIRFVAASGFSHGLDMLHDMLERQMQTFALFLPFHARFFAAFLLLPRLRSRHFFSARRAIVISVSAARFDASTRGPL